MALRTFNQILTDAVADVSAHGYTSPARVNFWLGQLRRSAERETAFGDVDQKLKTAYEQLVDSRGVQKYVPRISQFDISMVKPELRGELDRRIVAATDLIKIHREEAVGKVLQRFSGWATSIPPSGQSEQTRREVKSHIGKSVARFKFEQRRVSIDQGHKLLNNISNVVAMGNGAIAAVWRSHWRRPGYDYRPEHKKRDKVIFLIRDSWAIKEGLIKKGSAQYTDEIEMTGQLPFCSCYYVYITSPHDLPEDMLTEKGRKWIEEGMAA